MQKSCGEALKNARILQKIQIKKAADGMNISDRKLYMCEGDELKGKDPQLYCDAMMYYYDVGVGAAYLNEDPVYRALLGEIQLTDRQAAAARYATEFEGDAHVAEVLRWGLGGGESLLDRTLKRIRARCDALINLLLNNFTRPPGYAY